MEMKSGADSHDSGHSTVAGSDELDPDIHIL